jgi:hypothetical protein
MNFVTLNIERRFLCLPCESGRLALTDHPGCARRKLLHLLWHRLSSRIPLRQPVSGSLMSRQKGMLLCSRRQLTAIVSESHFAFHFIPFSVSEINIRKTLAIFGRHVSTGRTSPTIAEIRFG